jgi:hypothetical protein
MVPVTAESPQPAAAEPQQSAPGTSTEGSAAQSGAKGQPMGNQQLRIAILVVVAALVGIGLWLAFGHNSKHKKKGGGTQNITTAIGPKTLSKRQLQALPVTLNQPIYWAGPQKGYHYEFWRLKSNRVYVRYLPSNVPAGANGAHYLIVSTYPFPHAYKALKKQANGRGEKGPNNSFIWALPGNPKHVYIAWPKVPYEIEVFDPKASKAAAYAANGDVTTVG